MRHICSWCKNEIAPPDGAADDHLVTHGICERCKRGVLAEIEDIKRKKYEHRNRQSGRWVLVDWLKHWIKRQGAREI